MITANKAANLVGGKSTSTATARACDVCLCQRARWYCTADDAFLCQGCDSSVHSANQLACRHDRVRLEIKPPSSNYMPNITSGSEILLNSQPSWHQGFTRKARTPRNTKQVKPWYKVEKILKIRLPLVPEIGSEEACPNEDDEERLLYRVPVFDPFAAQLCKGSNNEVERAETTVESEFNAFLAGNRNDDLNNLRGFLPSDIELEEFAADVESLLGKGLDEDSCGIKGLGLLDGNEKDATDVCLEGTKVKIEDEDEEKDDVAACQLDMNLNLARQTIDWNFDYDDSLEIGDEDKVEAAKESTMMNDECKEEVKRKIFLRLNYEAVRAAWGTHCSPWTTGIRPEFNPDDDCWQDFMDWCATGYSHLREGIANRVRCDDGGREARVSRYREKRRTRLFSKKIRYEVRKLNAEKRPRMKGRFVKRMSFAGPSFPCLTKK